MTVTEAGGNMWALNGWEKVTCQRSNDLRVGAVPASSLTRTQSGPEGDAIVYTEWADPETGKPILRDYRWPDDADRECEHWTPAIEAASQEEGARSCATSDN